MLDTKNPLEALRCRRAHRTDRLLEELAEMTTTRTIRPPQFQVSKSNPCGLDGIEFVEFVSPEPEKLHALFTGFGFSRVMRHRERAGRPLPQNDITFLVNREPQTPSPRLRALHGPSIARWAGA
jgi:4-hydroxyphenylpyruvate dioxygenase-like putative hemolysin